MLAEERKSELGMLRAVGMKRNHLVRLFGLEGGVYSVIAAGVGMVLGIGAGQLMALVIGSIISEEEGLSIVFSVDPGSLVAGALAGLAVSLLTVWGTSARIARLNVIRAIRELPEPPVARASWRRMVLGSLGVVVGVLLLNAGVSGDSAIATMVGPALALGSAVPLASRWLPRRPVIATAGALAAFWAIASVELVPDAFADSDIEMFVVQGLVLVGAAVALVSQADRVWAWVADRLADRGGLASRLAVAYPLARRVRTAILLAMFSLIIFTLTFMSALSDANLAQAPNMAEEASAGWDLWVDSSPTNPLDSEQVSSTEGVAATLPAIRGVADVTSDADPEVTPALVTGVGPGYLDHGTPELSDRLDHYPDDRAALEAVLSDPTLAVTSSFVGGEEGPPSSGGLEVGDEMVATNPLTGEEQTFTVAGIIDADWAQNGVLISQDAATQVLGARGVESRLFVQVADGTDAETVADRLTGQFVDRGADAQTFTGVVEDEMRQMQGFIRLLQGYLGLGLLIGIAGLGVVMVRAVRERRRQIGMLRALGFSAQVVRRAFLSEAGFVAIQGIVLGIGLGLVTSYQMVTSDVFGDPLPFEWPWAALAILFTVPAAAALAATVAPAAQAAKIRPAAALRIAE
jgi:putative ABC transport system permease protein